MTVTQILFLAAYMGLVVLLRGWAQERYRQADEAKRQREEALRREWAVGIPYDPEPEPSPSKRRKGSS